MKEPVIANALDEAAKREILNNVSDTMTKEVLLARYVDSFLKQNGIENYETREISLRKAIASVVLGIVLFLEICWFMLYHPEQFIEIVDRLGVTEKIVRDSDATGALLLFCRAHLQINKNDLLRLVLILFLGRQETILSASSDMDSRLERKG